MDVVENTLGVDLDEFLDRPRFCFLAQASEAGPRVSPLWFLWEDGAVWIIAQLENRSYPDRVERDPRTALAVVDFDFSAGRVEHVGMRGRANLEPYDAGRADRLLSKYLGNDQEEWPGRFVGLPAEDYRLIRFDPETVVARDQSYASPVGPGGP
jgi:nitroimidazol reductase NimA-like FMN-containing flavoprotein (pyridoxamine 5'-phosphate oxidase superfamily)